MLVFKKKTDLQEYLKRENSSIGFVPTMGALHNGHLSLLQKAKKDNEITVCSIFVNPTQFNDKKDFEKYPITLEADIQKIIAIGTDILYLPDIPDIYPNGTNNLLQYPIGYLDTVLDGKFRPGHFNGVCAVVHQLLLAVQPTRLYLGEKDFQQCLVIQQLLQIIDSPVALIICPTLREPNGLAMSSRNERLSNTARQKAAILYICLQHMQTNWLQQSFPSLSDYWKQALLADNVELEYLLLAEADTLVLLDDFDASKKMLVLIAAKIEGVRLIDNIRVPKNDSSNTQSN